MAKWEKFETLLAPNHTWRATPGYQLCVMDRGDLHFEYPTKWHLEPEEGALRVTDKPVPNDDCCLRVSVLKFPGLKPGQPAPSLTLLLQNSFVECGSLLEADQIQRVPREDIEVIWGEHRKLNEKHNREAIWHIAMCHSSSPYRNLYAFLTCGFWPEDAHRIVPMWNHILKTLIMDHRIADPSKGPVLH